MALNPEEIEKWIKVGIYLGVIAGMMLSAGPDGIDKPTKVYYYGMRGMGAITRKSRKIEVWFMERYFEEVNSNGTC